MAEKKNGGNAKKVERKVIQVRATRIGFYGHMLRPVGTIFNFRPTEHEDCPPWCEPIDGEAAPDDEGTVADETGGAKGSSSDDVI